MVRAWLYGADYVVRLRPRGRGRGLKPDPTAPLYVGNETYAAYTHSILLTTAGDCFVLCILSEVVIERISQAD